MRADMRVPSGLYLQSRFFAATSGLWKRLGDLESRIVRQEIEQRRIDRPVYVASLPRSGTTIVTEMLARHPLLTSHHYSDFPNVWTPYWRNYLLKKARIQTPPLVERAHGDRIQVNNDSPEAVEELLWMHFFPDLHDASLNNVLDGQARNGQFDRFYQQHILKLLTVRNSHRYLAKGNYNIVRIRYILKLFPDARFLIPVRDPADHIASLMRQHERFNRASEEDRRIPRQMAMAGHFEFGPQRIPVNFSGESVTNPDELPTTRAIVDCWRQGREVEGWARYWADTYQHVQEQLDACPEVRKACMVFRYEDLCNHSARSIDAIMAHCELPDAGFEAVRKDYIDRLSPADYYDRQLDPDQLSLIGRFCDPVNEKLSKFCQN